MSEEATKEEVQKPVFEINTEDDLFRLMCIVKGLDPKQVQSLAKFMQFDNSDERSYYPTQLTVLAIAQLRILGEAFYPNDEWNEYTDIAEFLSIAFMGYKGWKSGQYVDITSGQPNLEKLKDLPEDTKKGVLSGILGAKKND